ncbi:MAG: DUF99 family protein, partial [Thermoplasmata archaeon]|nr:DUF99 family protein [Thermoplasmata archaeon]
APRRRRRKPPAPARAVSSMSTTATVGHRDLERALGKPHLRVIGLDDGAYTRRARRAPVVAVAMSLPDLVEGIELGWVEVDGRDATERTIALLQASPFLRGARAILVDGIALAGFNLLDLRRLSAGIGRPVLSVTRRAPEFVTIRAALRKYFPREFAARWALVKSCRLYPVPVVGRPLWVAAAGCRRAEAAAIVRRSVGHGRWPEPLRLAHLVGHSVGAHARPPRRPNP